MPEAITKYAINSTLGTTDFKPLDVQIQEQFSVISSDEIYSELVRMSLVLEKNTNKREHIFPYKIKMTRNGHAKLKGNIRFNSYKTTYGTFSILGNGVVVKDVDFNNSDSATTAFSADVSFKKGDVFSFKLMVSHSNGQQTGLVTIDMNLCGELKPSVFNYIS